MCPQSQNLCATNIPFTPRGGAYSVQLQYLHFIPNSVRNQDDKKKSAVSTNRTHIYIYMCVCDGKVPLRKPNKFGAYTYIIIYIYTHTSVCVIVCMCAYACACDLPQRGCVDTKNVDVKRVAVPLHNYTSKCCFAAGYSWICQCFPFICHA